MNQSSSIKAFILVFFSLITLFSACSSNNEKDRTEPLARVNDKYLFAHDIAELIPAGTNSNDSLALVNGYIDQWIKKQLLLKHAEFNLESYHKDFTSLIEDYRASLLIHEYKKQMLREKVDTLVTPAQIESYYNKNLQDFKLSGSVVKAMYIRSEKDNVKISDFRRLLTSTNEAAFEELVNLGYQYADRFDFFKDEWVSLNLILQKIPGSPSDELTFLRTNGLLETEDDEYIHLLKVHEYKLAGEDAPIEYVHQRITDLVRTQRKMDFLRDLEESIYRDALEKRDFENFSNKRNDN